VNLLTLSQSAFLLLAALVLWRCARAAARALDQARELKLTADARWADATRAFEVARRDREIAIAANAEACRRERNVRVDEHIVEELDEHIVEELVRARESLEALRGYEPVIVLSPQGPGAQEAYVLYVPQGFPVEQFLPHARAKGASA